MSIVALLNSADPAFGFENAMAHRTLLGGMAPLDSFSVLPYFNDPMQTTSRWRMMHQQAHTDALTTLPAWFGLPTAGINLLQNLIDVDFASPDQVRWWTWAHQLEHQVLMASLPLELTYPFW